MIAFLKGKLAGKTPQVAYIDVNGVGYAVFMSATALSKLPESGGAVTVLTYLQVSDVGIALYGFLSEEEKATFERLIGVTGVGPKVALAALSTFSPRALADAVAAQDVALVQKIPGVGKKSAQRMALEIGDKLGTPAALPGVDAAPAPAPSEDAVASEVSAALVGLGWSEAQAAKAIEKLVGSGLGASDMLRAALVSLGGGRG